MLYEHDEHAEYEKHDAYEEHDDDQDEANVITNYDLNIITTNLRSPSQSTGSPTMYQSLVSISDAIPTLKQHWIIDVLNLQLPGEIILFLNLLLAH